MIGVSKLYYGAVEPSDPLRYGRRSKDLPSHLLQFSEDKKPVIVWNITKGCNLKCVHCYAHATPKASEDELRKDEVERVIDDLADYGVPVILFSGGEPLYRSDLIDLCYYAAKKGIRVVISTNGTLITRDVAKRLKDVGLSYVGVSLDGRKETHDRFRGVDGAYDMAIEGILNVIREGIKVGLRFTIYKKNYREIPHMFELMRKYGIPRVCFYHLVYTGRASSLIKEDLSHDETRKVVDQIIDLTGDMFEDGFKPEVLTVDNHADGPYIYLRLLREGKEERAKEVLELLKMNEGNSSGKGIGCINWDGTVYPDQFWRTRPLGNVRERPFSEIWEDKNNEFLMMLKDKKKYVKGRCAKCRWLDVCGGNFRARAEAYYGDPWAPDPACYLTDAEIGIA